MKRLVTLLLCCTLLLGAFSLAYATQLGPDLLSGQTTVKLTIDPKENDFVVVIPSLVTIDPATKSGEFSITLKAGWSIPAANSLGVYLKSAKNGIGSSGAAFKLKGTNGKLYSYLLHVTPPGGSRTNVTSNNYSYTEILEVTKSTSSSADKVGKLTVTLSELPPDPGEYTDVLTFSVVLK